MSDRTHFELSRGLTLVDVVTLKDGSLRGEDVYDRNKTTLRFENARHMRAFAKKYNYTVTRYRNS